MTAINDRNRQTGFTLLEVVVIMPIMILTVAVLVAFLITVYGNLLSKNVSLQLAAEAQSALFSMRDDMFYAVRFASTNQNDTTDANAPSGGWNAVTQNSLIVYEAAYTAPREIANRQLVYKKDTPNPCNGTEIGQNQYSTNTLIYFVSGGTLYRRVLVPDQTRNCLSTYRLQTCPSAGSGCSQDVAVANDVKQFSQRFYSGYGNNAEITLAQLQTDPKQFIQVSRVDITLTLEKKVNAEPVDATASISIKKIE